MKLQLFIVLSLFPISFAKFDQKKSQQIAMGVFDVAQRLLQQLLGIEDKKVYLLSPISISSTLQTMYLGANGLTFDELTSL